MRGICLIVAVGLAGCTSTPKREMRQSTAEEFSTPPSNMYAAPPDVPRDKVILTPKSNPAMMNGPGMPGPGAGGPGLGGPGAMGGMPR